MKVVERCANQPAERDDSQGKTRVPGRRAALRSKVTMVRSRHPGRSPTGGWFGLRRIVLGSVASGLSVGCVRKLAASVRFLGATQENGFAKLVGTRSFWPPASFPSGFVSSLISAGWRLAGRQTASRHASPRFSNPP